MSASVKNGAGAGEKPWWIGGFEDNGQWQQLPGNVTAEEMLRLAKISHTVGKTPIWCYPTQRSISLRQPVIVPGLFAMLRTEEDGTTTPIPGVAVGEDYAAIQVQEAFQFGDDLISASQGSLPAHWHTAGELLDGTIWGLAKLDSSIYVAGDAIESYFLFSTKHDGKSALKVKLTNTRVVCKNTLNMASRDGTPREWSTKHTQFYQNRMEEARKILQLTTKAQAEFQVLANKLLEIPVPLKSRTFKELVDNLFPLPDKLLSQKQLDAHNEQRSSFVRSFGAPDLQNVKETGWGVVNAAADYEQHYKPINSKDTDKIVQTLFQRSFNSDAPTSLVTKAKEFVLVSAGLSV